MANRYYFRVPFSCNTYGNLTGYVAAENERDAVALIRYGSSENEQYDEEDSDNYAYFYRETELRLIEENVQMPEHSNSQPDSVYPAYFLSDINKL